MVRASKTMVKNVLALQLQRATQVPTGKTKLEARELLLWRLRNAFSHIGSQEQLKYVILVDLLVDSTP